MYFFIVWQRQCHNAAPSRKKKGIAAFVCSSLIWRYVRQFSIVIIQISAFSVVNPRKYSGARLSVPRCCGGGDGWFPYACPTSAIVCSGVVGGAG